MPVPDRQTITTGIQGRAIAVLLTPSGGPYPPPFPTMGQAFPLRTGPGRGAILQPPQPEIRPSAQVLERTADRDADWEPGD